MKQIKIGDYVKIIKSVQIELSGEIINLLTEGKIAKVLDINDDLIVVKEIYRPLYDMGWMTVIENVKFSRC